MKKITKLAKIVMVENIIASSLMAIKIDPIIGGIFFVWWTIVAVAVNYEEGKRNK